MQSFLKLTDKTRKEFSKHNQKLFGKLDYNANKLYVKGSYIIPVLSFFASDIDLYEAVPLHEASDFYTKFKNKVESLKDNIEYIEIYEQFKGTPREFLKISKEDFINLIKSGEGRVQMEMSFWEQGFIRNVSIMYDFKSGSNLKVSKVIEDLFDVIESKLKKSVMKALKRTYTMLSLMPENARRNKVKEKIGELLSDPLYGNLYLALTYLTAIQDTRLFKPSEKSEAMQNIKELVRKSGILTDSMIERFNKYSSENVKLLKRNVRTKLNELILSDPIFNSL